MWILVVVVAFETVCTSQAMSVWWWWCHPTPTDSTTDFQSSSYVLIALSTVCSFFAFNDETNDEALEVDLIAQSPKNVCWFDPIR